MLDMNWVNFLLDMNWANFLLDLVMDHGALMHWILLVNNWRLTNNRLLDWDLMMFLDVATGIRWQRKILSQVNVCTDRWKWCWVSRQWVSDREWRWQWSWETCANCWVGVVLGDLNVLDMSNWNLLDLMDR